MREISPEELSKIREEHKRWIDTDEKEGKRANLSEADLTQVKNFSINELSEAKTLYKAKLDPELMEQVKDKYPHLLEEPKVNSEPF